MAKVRQPSVGGGRPKGSKNHIPDKFCKGADAEIIRKMLTDAFKDNINVVIPRLFKELSSLEGFAYISGVNMYLSKILPALQSVELKGEVKQTKSLLLEHIEQLKITKN